MIVHVYVCVLLACLFCSSSVANAIIKAGYNLMFGVGRDSEGQRLCMCGFYSGTES